MLRGLWRYLYQRQSAIDEGIEGGYAFFLVQQSALSARGDFDRPAR
jgi:hypothetical protein